MNYKIKNLEAESIVSIQSETDSTKSYNINLKDLTCSCPHFYKKLHAVSIEDPHRLCKHLIRALHENGIPEHLKSYTEDILWFARHGVAFTSREKVRKQKKLPLSEGCIITVTSDKKVKYCYLSGKVNEDIIHASLPLNSDQVSLTINNFHGVCNLKENICALPKAYQYMEKAILSWLITEKNKLK